MDTYQVKVEREGRLVVEYGLVMKDMYSGYMWHVQLQSKDEAVACPHRAGAAGGDAVRLHA